MEPFSAKTIRLVYGSCTRRQLTTVTSVVTAIDPDCIARGAALEVLAMERTYNGPVCDLEGGDYKEVFGSPALVPVLILCTVLWMFPMVIVQRSKPALPCTKVTAPFVLAASATFFEIATAMATYKAVGRCEEEEIEEDLGIEDPLEDIEGIDSVQVLAPGYVINSVAVYAMVLIIVDFAFWSVAAFVALGGICPLCSQRPQQHPPGPRLTQSPKIEGRLWELGEGLFGNRVAGWLFLVLYAIVSFMVILIIGLAQEQSMNIDWVLFPWVALVLLSCLGVWRADIIFEAVFRRSFADESGVSPSQLKFTQLEAFRVRYYIVRILMLDMSGVLFAIAGRSVVGIFFAADEVYSLFRLFAGTNLRLAQQHLQPWHLCHTNPAMVDVRDKRNDGFLECESSTRSHGRVCFVLRC